MYDILTSIIYFDNNFNDITDSSISCAISRKARSSKKTAIVGQEIQQ